MATSDQVKNLISVSTKPAAAQIEQLTLLSNAVATPRLGA
jgi:hypothetical protein